MTRLTMEDLDVLLAKHVPTDSGHAVNCEPTDCCDKCDEWWPCDIYLLATEVRAAREEHRLTSEFLSGLAKADCLPMGVGDIQEMGYRLEQDIWVLAHYEEGRTT